MRHVLPLLETGRSEIHLNLLQQKMFKVLLTVPVFCFLDCIILLWCGTSITKNTHIALCVNSII